MILWLAVALGTCSVSFVGRLVFGTRSTAESVYEADEMLKKRKLKQLLT